MKNNKSHSHKKSLYSDYVLYGILIIVLAILVVNIVSFMIPEKKQEMQEERGMHMTEFDRALAKKLMDKNNDGICDACGMSVDQCIQGGMMECSMAPDAKIGLLGSAHVHPLFKVYNEGKQMEFSNKKYFVKSMFVHVEEDPNNMTGRIIHVHATGVPLSLFFDSLEMNMSKYSLFVNNKETDYATYTPADGDLILLTTTQDGEKLKEELMSVKE